MCCKVMEIAELAKPVGSWCSFCATGKGCRIKHQPERPQSCEDFLCLWLQGLGTERMRPDRSKVVMSCTKDGKSLVLHVDPGTPDAYRAPEFEAVIDRLVRDGRSVYVALGSKRRLIRGVGADAPVQPRGSVLENRTRRMPHGAD